MQLGYKIKNSILTMTLATQMSFQMMEKIRAAMVNSTSRSISAEAKMIMQDAPTNVAAANHTSPTPPCTRISNKNTKVLHQTVQTTHSTTQAEAEVVLEKLGRRITQEKS